MSSHARHASPRDRGMQRALLRAAVTASATGAALAAGVCAASAQGRLAPVDAGAAVGTLKNLPLNPLANTGADPLDNSVSTQVADLRPVGTQSVTGPLSNGDSLSELPLVGKATGVLPG